MKNNYIVLALSLFILSCSSDDNNNSGSNNNTPDPANYMPDASSNYWVYDTQSEGMSGRDSLYIANDTVIENNNYKKYKTAQPPMGLYSNSMNNNGVRKSDGKLLLTGGVSFAISEALPLSIPITDFVIFDSNAAPEQTMGTLTGVINQQIESFQVRIAYTLSSKSKAALATYTVPGQPAYTNVKPVETTLNLQISVSGFAIMQSQNVLVSTQYYAENIGVVYADTNINYQLIDLSGFGIDLPVPTSGAEHQTETLVKYKAD